LNFAEYVSKQPVAFTALVGARPLSWLQLHPEQIQPATGTPVAYEIGMTSWGMPVAIWPRAADEIGEPQRRLLQRGRPVVLRINEPELAQWTCNELVKRNARGTGWVFTERGQECFEILTYTP
jgi:hypothetical protein